MAVYLKPVTRSDKRDLICSNVENKSYHEPWVYPFSDAEGFENWFSETLSGTTVSLVARARETDGVVGVVNFSQIFMKGFQNAYLGFYGMVAHAGRGLMTDAVRLALSYAFAEIGLHRVEANIQPGNLRSIALVKRVGFRKEGFSPQYLMVNGDWRDHERWALVANEWPTA